MRALHKAAGSRGLKLGRCSTVFQSLDDDSDDDDYYDDYATFFNRPYGQRDAYNR